METTNRPWLARLKQLEAENRAKHLLSLTDKTDTTPPIGGSVGFVGDSPKDFGREVAWRVAAFRTAIPARDPIWPPRIRDIEKCDTPGHCSLCGDELPTDLTRRFPRCTPCVRALWLALNWSREDVPVVPEQGAEVAGA